MENQSVALELDGDVAVLRIQRGKGNSLNAQLVEELLDVMRRPELAESQALVLTGADGFFSAGLDLVELSQMEEERLLAFVDRLQGLMAMLYVWNRPVIAAVSGHAIAGGCLLALCADWRVLSTEKAKMGLNEITLGLPLPQAGLEISRAQLTQRAWSEVVFSGELFDAEDCQRLGLCDELAAPDEVLPRALERARAWASRPPVAFHRVKATLRDRVLLRIREEHERRQEEWVSLWFEPDVQEQIRQAVQRLTKRR